MVMKAIEFETTKARWFELPSQQKTFHFSCCGCWLVVVGVGCLCNPQEFKDWHSAESVNVHCCCWLLLVFGCLWFLVEYFHLYSCVLSSNPATKAGRRDDWQLVAASVW